MLMAQDYYLIEHEQIFSTLLKWKILNLNQLMQKSNYTGKYNSFTKLIARLERKEMLSSGYFFYPKVKYVYLNNEFAKVLSPDNHPVVVKNYIYHDSLVTNVLMTLSNSGYFHNFEFPYQETKFWEKETIEPDGILYYKKQKGGVGKLALEVELIPKSQNRIFEKFDIYQTSEYFNSILYIFNREGALKTYLSRFEEFLATKETGIFNRVKKKIYFMLIKDLASDKLNFSKEELFLGKKRMSFKEYLGNLQVIGNQLSC